MSDTVPSTSAATRTADALLRSAGGRSVLLRTSSPATPGDPTEQLGLATPTFQDLELAPVLFRKAQPTVSPDKGARLELLVSASTVLETVGSLAFDSASVLFANALGVLIDGVLMEIETANSSELFGVVYLYRLVLRAPRSLTT